MFKALLRVALTAAVSLLLTAGYALTAYAEELNPRMHFLLKTKITHHGPNCWNAALVASGVMPHFRYTSPREFLFLMNSPACKKIAPELRRRGDIQVYLRNIPGLSEEQRQVHANIWLNDVMAFNKRTDFATAAYEVTPHLYVNDDYARTPEIFIFTLEDGKNTQVKCHGESCQNLIEYRRCQSIENLKQKDPSYTAEIEYFINVLELSIQGQVRRPSKATVSWHANAEGLLSKLEEAIRRTCGSENSFYCEYARNAHDSLTWQIQRPQPSWLN